MSYVKMEVVNSAEKEASEVLHSLLSVDRRALDSKENIIVSIPSSVANSTQAFVNGDPSQWHTPVLNQQSVFTIPSGQVIQADFPQSDQQQVLWQGHTIQIGNDSGVVGGGTILQELYPIVSITDDLLGTKMESETVEKRPIFKKPASKVKKPSVSVVSSSDDNNDQESEERNKLEDNPLQVKARLKKGCECKDSCYRGLRAENVYKHRLNIAELTKSEHDMYLMGLTMACLANPSETSRRKARRRLRASYVYQGRRVCLEAFLYLENVTHYQLKRIRHHVMTHGVIPRTHGNVGKKPFNTFSLNIYQHATEFLKQYLEQHVGTKDFTKPFAIQGNTRRKMFDAYREYGEVSEPGWKLMGFSTFRTFIKEQFPNLRFMVKRADIKDVPFKSGKCMTYDKNKDPVRIEAERVKAEVKKAVLSKKKELKNAKVEIQINTSEDDVDRGSLVVRQLQTVQVSQTQPVQQVQTVQQVQAVSQMQSIQVPQDHQIVQQMNVQTVSDDSSSQPIEITQQVIPLTVVQQPQHTYIVTPVSHLQTSVHGGWYSRQ